MKSIFVVESPDELTNEHLEEIRRACVGGPRKPRIINSYKSRPNQRGHSSLVIPNAGWRGSDITLDNITVNKG